ncbi:uncharacterized protein LOC129589637 isoform X2 [Paramacrobiotus metropolitanus]|nr:uncharacterized protein LOC129589637 isoform X2 [Paramacrobiotus metropolitanus]XP_055340436.1 uncharacterized protein LOC129589637 isoform X2 [Paramacrobiotus metropolitanus]XP_055340437.1 uncharacterized protein LOC129589637 isoform X2 [Paramacrobiotus metropolitanus]XP_055340438.1 uncharacterized protein LOC129589637 isoform X2 [Paramacrobiotus metropolitanus]
MAAHKQNCHPDRLLFGGLMGQSRGLGFGSYMTNGLSAYHIAQMAQRRFHILHYEWPYEKLTTFFDDFARNTRCPIFGNMADQQAVTLLNNKNNYHLVYENDSVVVTKEVDLTPVNPSEGFHEMRRIITYIYDKDFAGHFRTKSLLAKAMWQLKPHYADFVKKLMSGVLANGFIGVHLRRTDKIASKEMANIPIQDFALKIREVFASKSYSKCVVFVMTDDQSASDLLQRLLTDRCSLYTIVDLAKTHGFDPGKLFMDPLHQVKHHVPRTNREYWIKHTTQLILEMTILALADDLVCTLSSNLCNVVVLLRGSYNASVYSLDLPWTPV